MQVTHWIALCWWTVLRAWRSVCFVLFCVVGLLLACLRVWCPCSCPPPLFVSSVVLPGCCACAEDTPHPPAPLTLALLEPGTSYLFSQTLKRWCNLHACTGLHPEGSGVGVAVATMRMHAYMHACSVAVHGCTAACVWKLRLTSVGASTMHPEPALRRPVFTQVCL